MCSYFDRFSSLTERKVVSSVLSLRHYSVLCLYFHPEGHTQHLLHTLDLMLKLPIYSWFQVALIIRMLDLCIILTPDLKSSSFASYSSLSSHTYLYLVFPISLMQCMSPLPTYWIFWPHISQQVCSDLIFPIHSQVQNLSK